MNKRLHRVVFNAARGLQRPRPCLPGKGAPRVEPVASKKH
ncbi:hypothetical protein EJI01_02955 [Variovorax sp. MHTC-1]|nr:hypothetical protein EJI01_02955 [Variovorax sp. MHTC-1]